MAVDEQDIPISVKKSVEGMGDTKSMTEQKRLESLLLDDSDNERPVQYLAEQEIRVVSSGKTNRFGLLIGLVLLFFAIGSGYYYLSNINALQLSTPQSNLYSSPKLPVPARPKIDIPVAVDVAKVSTPGKRVAGVTPLVASEIPLFTVTVGPFINSVELRQAMSQLQELGLNPQKNPGRGPIRMIRLLEGVYPAAKARARLAMVQKVVKSAFLMPDGDNLAVYAGSFHQEDRAQQLQEDLADKMLNVTLVNSDITMDGTMLTALQADQQTAREVAGHISSFGLQAQVFEKK